MRTRANYGPVAAIWPRSSRPSHCIWCTAGVERRVHQRAHELALDVVDSHVDGCSTAEVEAEVGGCVEGVGPHLERGCRCYRRCFGRGFGVGVSVARPGEKGASVDEAVLCGTNAPLSGGVRTIDWSSGQSSCETRVTITPVLSIR